MGIVLVPSTLTINNKEQDKNISVQTDPPETALLRQPLMPYSHLQKSGEFVILYKLI